MIRPLEEKDKGLVKALYEKHNLPEPKYGVCLVVEELGNIIGVINGGTVNFIESIVSESPRASEKLFLTLEGFFLGTGLPTTFAGTINDEAGDLLVKLGYDEIKGSRFFIKRR
jgi:hypothetical protein